MIKLNTYESIETRLGQLFFRHRNWLFPVIAVALFSLARPSTKMFGSDWSMSLIDSLAILMCLLGLGIRATVIGFAYIKRGGVDKKVFAERLQTAGMFSLCRNPIYCGNMLIWPSVFLLYGNLALFAIGTLIFFAIYTAIIHVEEAYLREKFGQEYVDYCQTTPRWIPRWQRFGEATRELTFDWRRVVLNDYSTIATAIISLALVEMYKCSFQYGMSETLPMTLAGLIALTLLAAIAVKIIKKRGLMTVG